jgi:hypothetical protein
MARFILDLTEIPEDSVGQSLFILLVIFGGVVGVFSGMGLYAQLATVPWVNPLVAIILGVVGGLIVWALVVILTVPIIILGILVGIFAWGWQTATGHPLFKDSHPKTVQVAPAPKNSVVPVTESISQDSLVGSPVWDSIVVQDTATHRLSKFKAWQERRRQERADRKNISRGSSGKW